MEIRPILSSEDHSNALQEIEALWGASPGTPEGDKLDVLITLVDRYEDEHFPIEVANPIDLIKTHMEMTGRSQRDLALLLESDSRASELLNRRRALTLEMVHRLHKEWGIPAEYLVIPYELDRSHVHRVRVSQRAAKRGVNPVRKRA